MNRFIDWLLSRKGLYVTFWTVAILMVTVLIGFTARLPKEVPPIPQTVRSVSGESLYTYSDIVTGKGYFQEFDLTDWGTMLGMGAYIGPDFTTDFLHLRAVSLYNTYGHSQFGKHIDALSDAERAMIKTMVIEDIKKKTQLTDDEVVYTDASANAFKENREYLKNYLVNGKPEQAWKGGVIRPEEADKIAAFVDWSQLVASTIRPDTDRTWSNNWPAEPLIDQNSRWSNHFYSLWEFLLLWPLSILVVFIGYEYLVDREKTEKLEKALVVKKLFPSQIKLKKYVPIVALFFLIQTIIGGYLAHLYTEPTADFLISQSILPFNVLRALHTNIAIIWVAIGWLVGGLLIAPFVSNEDLKFPWLVDILWVALLIVGAGGIVGIYLGATGHLRDWWFWFGNEGRELLNLGRVWDTGLVIGLVLWFLMVYSIIRKAKTTNVLLSTIIWSAFAIATLYIAGMMPYHKIAPNFTVDDYYRWWVIHLWVEMTFELFAAGALAFFTASLGLVSQKTAERVMLFELLLIIGSGTLGVGHHYWFQGLDEYWIAIGAIFSALEPLPLGVLMIDAWKEQQHIKKLGEPFEFSTPFLWLAGSAFLNWFGAGFLGMVINTPTIDYYAHGTYLIMPHGHVALLGAFGYISIAFIYMTARSNALANNLEWNDTPSRWGFWILTIGTIIFAIPTLIIGFHQAEMAFVHGYYATRLRETVELMKGWMWFRLLPDTMMIIGSATILIDVTMKTYFAKKLSK